MPLSRAGRFEELRRTLSRVAESAPEFYRYGNPDAARVLWHRLDDRDQRVLLLLALVEGSKEAREVLWAVVGAVPSRELLMDSLDAEDRALVLPGFAPTSGASIEERVSEVLNDAIPRLGKLLVEEAYWVLISPLPGVTAVWIPAMSANIPKVDSVWDAPSPSEMDHRLGSMRAAARVLHLHNHPDPFARFRPPTPSTADIESARAWLAAHPELAQRTEFYVVNASASARYPTSEQLKDAAHSILRMDGDKPYPTMAKAEGSGVQRSVPGPGPVWFVSSLAFCFFAITVYLLRDGFTMWALFTGLIGLTSASEVRGATTSSSLDDNPSLWVSAIVLVVFGLWTFYLPWDDFPWWAFVPLTGVFGAVVAMLQRLGLFARPN